MLLFTKHYTFQYLNTTYIIFLSYEKLHKSLTLLFLLYISVIFSSFWINQTTVSSKGHHNIHFAGFVLTTYSTAPTLNALTQSVKGKSAALEPAECWTFASVLTETFMSLYKNKQIYLIHLLLQQQKQNTESWHLVAGGAKRWCDVNKTGQAARSNPYSNTTWPPQNPSKQPVVFLPLGLSLNHSNH